MWSTGQYDLFNRNGAPLCHAVKCRKHKRLIASNNGWFCHKHLKQLQEIRQLIKLHSEDEVKYRHQEMLFRKRFDPGHVWYINHLE